MDFIIITDRKGQSLSHRVRDLFIYMTTITKEMMWIRLILNDHPQPKRYLNNSDIDWINVICYITDFHVFLVKHKHNICVCMRREICVVKLPAIHRQMSWNHLHVKMLIAANGRCFFEKWSQYWSDFFKKW